MIAHDGERALTAGHKVYANGKGFLGELDEDSFLVGNLVRIGVEDD